MNTNTTTYMNTKLKPVCTAPWQGVAHQCWKLMETSTYINTKRKPVCKEELNSAGNSCSANGAEKNR